MHKTKMSSSLRHLLVALVGAVALTFSLPAVSATADIVLPPDVRTGPTVHCPAGTTVGAYSHVAPKFTGMAVTYNRHKYTSTSGTTYTVTRYSAPAFHVSSSPYRSAKTTWSTDGYIVTLSNSCG